MRVHTLDLEFRNVGEAIAAFLLEGPEGLALVETGPMSTLGTLRKRLREKGVDSSEVRHVLVTHIHLDHSGAAGWWAQRGAKVYVHEVGAPHLIDPKRLLSSAERIYGDRMDELWGRTLPAPAENVIPVKDGDRIKAAGLEFTALDTPGHAWHHHAYRVEDIAFVGDAAGIRLPGSPFIVLPAPPPEFDPPAWKRSLDRLLEQGLGAIYPTHFGLLDDVDDHLRGLGTVIDESSDFVRERMAAGVQRDEMIAQYRDWSRKRGQEAGLTHKQLERYEIANPQDMSVDGMMRYWQKKSPPG